MKIALAQINPTVGDLEGNTRLIIETARQAGAAGAAVVAFPELAISGYPPEDLLLKDHFLVGCRQALLEVAAGCKDIVALVGVPLLDGAIVSNAAAILARGAIVGSYRKIWLPNYAVFDEKRYFVPGDRVVVLEMPGVRLGVNICEDVWDDCGPTEAAVFAGGAQIVVNLSMSPYHLGKGGEREAMLARRAREAGMYLCYVNGVGGQDELVFDGQSLVFDPSGRLVARACQFEEQLLVVDLDPGSARRGQDPQCALSPWPVERIPVDVSVDAGPRPAPVGAVHTDVAEPLAVEAEVYAALRLGVRDYLAKNGFQKAVMGLSGGIDSALTACIAADALGNDKVTAVSMPSRYSSSGTKSDARETAQRLGIHFHEIPI
ncbi:MAG: nitrilase-related carbon-nitrogen hydrolase, partial [bacterium]